MNRSLAGAIAVLIGAAGAVAAKAQPVIEGNVLRAAGKATVVQDELENTYQKLD